MRAFAIKRRNGRDKIFTRTGAASDFARVLAPDRDRREVSHRKYERRRELSIFPRGYYRAVYPARRGCIFPRLCERPTMRRGAKNEAPQ